MPPEQFENAAGCDERSDIYSFGIVLYQMAARGRLPFFATMDKQGSAEALSEFWNAMYLLHCNAPVPPIELSLFPVLTRCLEKTREKRYQTFAEVRGGPGGPAPTAHWPGHNPSSNE